MTTADDFSTKPQCPTCHRTNFPPPLRGFLTEIQMSKRIRITVATTSKGVKSYDCTVEIEGQTIEEVLAESDRLVRLLDTRYGPGKVDLLALVGELAGSLRDFGATQDERRGSMHRRAAEALDAVDTLAKGGSMAIIA